MKICIFTSAHLVNDIRVFKKEIISLLNNGYEVVYYTNRLDKNMDSKYVKNSKYAELEHKKLHIIYNDDYNEDKRIKRFIRSFLTFFKLDKSCEIYHFHDPDLIITGLLLKVIGKKVIYDVHENYINTIEEKEYIPVWARKTISYFFERLENFAAKRFDVIVTATPKIAERFTSIDIKSVVTINNFPFTDELLIEKDNSIQKENVVIYTGGITKKRGLTQLVNAMALVNKKIPCKLVLAGQIYPNEYAVELHKLDGWNFVNYMGLLTREDMAVELSKAKVGVVLFLPEKNHIDAQPNKLFEYMSAKLPIVCSAFPLWEEIVVENELGTSANPLSSEDIAKNILILLKMDEDELKKIGEKGKKLIETKYNWYIEEKKLLKVYKKLGENEL
jgi:glycosyltransferase involved in cell wall biosynthesis